MKIILLVTTMVITSIITFAQQLPADKIIGIWESVDSEVGLKFEIYKSGDKKY
ncbi:hypothetical protein [Emticicia agri]|uniref:hypothetical protein n=1 Tax=Emticicia agri TaxID=2492393 RepID=UPI0013EA7720|nr:hypothetical protein [Emticicia agri]